MKNFFIFIVLSFFISSNSFAKKTGCTEGDCNNGFGTWTYTDKTTYVGEWEKIDQSCINGFADITGDRQWIHTNPEKAKIDSPFKTTIAHGFLTLALIPNKIPFKIDCPVDSSILGGINLKS